MTTKISKYFTLEEMIFSQTAARQGIDNSPFMCEDVGEPPMAAFSSGLR